MVGLEDLDSLSFSTVKRLLERICKSLGFRLFHCPISFAPVYICWHLDAGDVRNAVFLEGHNRDDFRTAKDLLRGILAVKAFKLRSLDTGEEKIIPNPFCGLGISALKIKLDLLA